MDDRNGLITGGNKGPAVVPGEPGKSLLVAPPKPGEPPFDPDQIDQTGEAVVEDVVRPRDARAAAWMAFTQALLGSAEFRYVK